MRHGIAGNTLNRKTAHRKATVRDIAKATLIQEQIMTTLVKAREARKLVDKLITLGKSGSLANKRRAFSILCDHQIVSDLFNKTAPRFQTRKGGYTRIIKYHNRRGDNAELAILELVEKAPIEAASVPDADKENTKAKDKTTVKSKAETKKPDVEDAEVVPDTKGSAEKASPKKVDKKQDQGKKNVFGGVKKMFNRRQSGK